MEDTEAGYAESNPQKPKTEPTNLSSDVETFCAASLKLLGSTEGTDVRLHDTLTRFEECGKRCKFCRYLYESFDDEITEIHAQCEIGDGPYVQAWTGDIRTGGKHKMVEKAALTLSLRKDDGYRGKIFAWRNYDVLSNGSM
jgi:hypothetical protein